MKRHGLAICLVALLLTPSPIVAQQTGMPDNTDRSALERLVDSNVQARIDAADALRDAGQPSELAVPALRARLRDDEPEVRRAAAAAMLSFGVDLGQVGFADASCALDGRIGCQAVGPVEDCRISEKMPEFLERAKGLALKNNPAHPALFDQAVRIVCSELPTGAHEQALKHLMSMFVAPNSISVMHDLFALSGRNSRLQEYMIGIAKSGKKERHKDIGLEASALQWWTSDNLRGLRVQP